MEKMTFHLTGYDVAIASTTLTHQPRIGELTSLPFDAIVSLSLSSHGLCADAR